MARVALLGLICLALLCSLGWFLIEGGNDPLAPTAAPKLEAVETPVRAEVAPLTLESHPPARATVEEQAVEAASPSSATGPPDEDEGRLRVQVVDAVGVPLEGALVGVSEGAGTRIVEGTQGRLGQSVSTGPDGSVTFQLPANRELRGRVNARTLGFEGASFVIAALTPGEERERVVPLQAQTWTRFHGRVIDAHSERPIGGALLRRSQGGNLLGSPSEKWSTARDWSISEGEVVATTDVGGNFALESDSLGNPVLEVYAEGYGPRWVQASEFHPDAGDPGLVRMLRNGTIVGTIGVESPVGKLQIGALVQAFYLRDPDQAMSTMILGELLWKAEPSVDGRYRLENLPAGAPIQLEVRIDGETTHRTSSPIKLEPGEEYAYDWQAGAGTSLRGRLVREDGRAARPTEIWLASGDRARTPLAILPMHTPPLKRTQSLADGTFFFADVSPGTYYVGPARSSRDERSPHPAVRVEVPTSAEVQVTVPTEGRIEGVVTLDGEPVEGVSVRASHRDLRGGWAAARTNSAGRFQLGPLLDGTWKLIASSGSGSTRAIRYSHIGAPVEVAVGTTDVEIPVQRTARLSVSVVDASTGQPLPALIFLRRDGRAVQRMSSPLKEFEFRDLDPGQYVVHAWASDGRVALTDVGPIAAGETREGVVVELEVGGIVRFEGTPQGQALGFVRNGEEVGSLWPTEGLSATLGLPAGTYAVTQRKTHDAPPLQKGEITIHAGEETLLQLDEDGEIR